MNRRAIYTRPDKPMTIEVKQRDRLGKMQPIQIAEPVAVDRFTECHVTPSHVAARMVEYLGRAGELATLEPSAGTGQITRALMAAGYKRDLITQIERHHRLASGIAELAPVVQRCFLEYATEARGAVKFPRVIMNPPFSEVRKHIAAALALLGRDGHPLPAVLVALVPITFGHPDADTLETLPADTFRTARVHTKIIRIIKP